MPTYEFQCDEDRGGCNNVVTIRCSYGEKKQNRPKSCPKCRKRKTIIELFGSPNPIIPKTLGSIAEKNSDKISADEKAHIHNKNNEYRKKDGPSWIEGPGGSMVRNPKIITGER